MNSIGRLLFSSLTGVVCEKFVGAAAAIASNHLFAHIYGVQSFGSLQFALALSSILGSVAAIISSEAVAPILGKHSRLRHIVFYRAFRLRAAFALGIMVPFVVIVLLQPRSATTELALVACLLLIADPLAVGSLMAYAERTPWVVTRARMLGSGLRVLWLYAAAHWATGPIIAALAWPIEAFISTVGPFSRYQKLALHSPKTFFGDDVVKRTMIIRGLKFWPAIAASVLIVRVDRLLLATLLSKTDLGIYSAAASLLEQWNSVGAALALALAPSMVFSARNDIQLRKNAQKLAICLASLALIAFLGSLVIGRTVFVLIYGSAFESGAPIMIFATACTIVNFADAGLSTWIIAGRRYRLALIKQFMSLSLIVTLPFIVPHSAVMYAPSAASAAAVTLFWSIHFAGRAFRNGRLLKPANTNSYTDTHT